MNNTHADKAARDRALFDRIAVQYAAKDRFPASVIARQMRLRQTLNQVGLHHDADILELGCGAGFAARYLSGSYGSYTGIDYSEELIRFASAENALPCATFQVADIDHYEPGREFDAVFMIGVLHHMTDMPAAIDSAMSFTRPGGAVVVNEPQPTNPIIHALRSLRAVVDSAYSNEQEELTAAQVIELYEKSGLVNVESTAQGFFSTPFAEVMIKPGFVSKPLSYTACCVDRVLERRCSHLLRNWSWNVIVAGWRPG